MNRHGQARLLDSRVQSLTNAEAKRCHCLGKYGAWWYVKYNGIYHLCPWLSGHEPYLKRKGWFSLLSMQNIIFQYKMVLDDCLFFFFSYPMVPSNPSGRKRSRTSYNFLLQLQSHSHSKTRSCWAEWNSTEYTNNLSFLHNSVPYRRATSSYLTLAASFPYLLINDFTKSSES